MLVAEDLGYSGKALEMKVCIPPYDYSFSPLITISRYQIIMHLANSLESPLLDFESATDEGMETNLLI
jgi:hypothetical protein